jgi:hypothetical protein
MDGQQKEELRRILGNLYSCEMDAEDLHRALVAVLETLTGMDAYEASLRNVWERQAEKQKAPNDPAQ